MKRPIFGEEHELFRTSVRAFLAREVVPHRADWEQAGIVPRELWRAAGEQGLLCPWLEERYGGPGADFLASVIVTEELARVRASGALFQLHSDVVVPYLRHYGTEEQRARWLPGCASGELITAVAMTEPGAGSDLAAMRTSAVRDGDHYVVNGSKTFISNGHLCDLVVLAAKTDPASDPPHAGVSLLVVEAGTPGFEKGKRLAKMGMHAQDTAELHFDDCRVPAGNLLGAEGLGFLYLMQQLAQERLVVAVHCVAAAEAALADTLAYTRQRRAFGKPLSAFQNTRFELVEMATEIELGRHLVDRLVAEHMAGTDVATETCMAKWWCSEMLKRVTDRCLQLFGGYGYMMETEICRAFLDARAQTIFAGTTEIMKNVVASRMGL